MNGRRLRIPIRGLLLLAIGRSRGLEEFGTDTDAYLTSLAPFLALVLVFAVLAALAGEPRAALLLGLRQLCLLLAPAVLAELFCRLWQRRPEWARYATILNWSIWLEMTLVLLIYAAAAAAQQGVLPAAIALGLTAGLPIYLLAYQWFIARVALRLSHGRVALLLLANLIVSLAIVAASFYGVPSAQLKRELTSPDAANGSVL